MSSTAKPSSRTPVAPPVSVVREIDSPADAVWAMVSDLARMGEWSPENQGGQWVNGATGPALGARFKGRNANGTKSWGTTVEVVEYDAPRTIAFALMVGRSRWCDWCTPSRPLPRAHAWLIPGSTTAVALPRGSVGS